MSLYILLLLFVGLSGTTKATSLESSISGAERLLSRSNERQNSYLSSSPSSELPYLTVSYAQTLDGSISPLNRTRLDISSTTSFRLLHSLRAAHGGVVVGINTVLCDQPRLNIRDPLPSIGDFEKQPRPIVIDTHLRILEVEEGKLLLQKPIVFTSVPEEREEEEVNCVGIQGGDICRTKPTSQTGIHKSSKWLRAKQLLEGIGGELVHVSTNPAGHCNLKECFVHCKEKMNIRSLLVEGGAGIIQSVLEENLIHQVIVTVKPSYFGGYRSMTRELENPFQLHEIQVENIAGDIVIQGFNRYAD
jgi:GTP cyclohydrolase II